MSKHRPLIGVPTAELPGFHPDEPRLWAMRVSYITPIFALGGLPVLLPNITTLEELTPLLSQLDGLLLAGGHDIDPTLYGSRPTKHLEQTDPTRDRSELLITRWALANKLPILAICRGMQMINVAAGGTLHQNVAGHRANPVVYMSLTRNGHPITIRPGSRLFAITGQSKVWVNSLHHQAVADVGSNLTITAQAPDGVIEAIEVTDPKHWCVGLQSHPEAIVDQQDWVRELFTEFLQASRNYNQNK